MTVQGSYKSTSDASTENLLDVDVSNIVWHVGEPTEAPLITLTGGDLYTDGKDKPEKVAGIIKREIAKEVSYKIIEKDPLARDVTVGSAVADTTTTTIVLSANTNLTVGDTLVNKSQSNDEAAGEFVLVYAVDSGGTDISARRNLGGTEFTIAAGDIFRVCGFACKQGAEKRTLKSQLAAPRTRYTQILKRSFGITDTLRNVEIVTKPVLYQEEERIQALAEHKKDIEFSFWLNPSADSSTDTGGSTVNLTRGIIAELANSGDSIRGTGSLSEAQFFGAIAEKIFEYGPGRKRMFLSPHFKSIMGEWSRVKQQTKPKETKYGINLIEIETNHGILELITAGVFGQYLPDALKGYGVVVDTERIVYKNIPNRDTKYQEKIETPGADVFEAQYITECGLQLRSLKHHKVIWDVG